MHLHTAFLIEPVLKTDGKIGLIPAINLRITVESLTTGYDIECIDHRDAEGGITTARADIAILTTEPLGTDAGRTSFLIFGR